MKKKLTQLFRLIFFLIMLVGTRHGFTQTLSDSCPTLNIDIVIMGESITLTPKAKLKLDSVFKKMKNYPSCKIHVKGHSTASEEGQQISWDKVAAVIKYLRTKGIKKENFLFDYGDYENREPAIVNLTSSTAEGPTWVPQPHPCYSLHQPRKKRCAHGIPH